MYDVDHNSGEDGRPSPPVSEHEDYELVYGGGGHGGPHHGITSALDAARRLLAGSPHSGWGIYVVPRSSPTYHARHAVRYVRK